MTMPATLPPTHRLREILEPFAEYAARISTPTTVRVTPFDLEGAVVRSWPVGDGRCEQRSDGNMIELAPMLQATRAFTATYDGSKVRIDKHTRVVVGHDIALAHPDSFAPMIGVGLNARVASRPAARARSATTTPTRRDSPSLHRPPAKRPAVAAPSPPQYRVELRDTESRAKVTISEFAYEVIERECIRFARFDDVETGGFLAGPVVQSWHRSISVTNARGPGPKSEHKPHELRIDLTGDVQLERDFAWSDANIGEAGQWHTHPSGGPTPSPPDLDTWADSLRYVSDKRGSGLYLGVIATPRKQRGHWNFPTLTAYIIRRGERSGFVCEPAVVSIRSSTGGGW